MRSACHTADLDPGSPYAIWRPGGPFSCFFILCNIGERGEGGGGGERERERRERERERERELFKEFKEFLICAVITS
jgi:hypothetical protein